MAQFFIDLNNEKSERLKLHATIRQLEDELAQLRRQLNEPSPSWHPTPFTVNPPSFAAFQDYSAVDNIQKPKTNLINTLERASSTTSQSRVTEQPRASPSIQTTSGSSPDLKRELNNWKKK